MRKNGKFYLPYLLTCVGAASMFYIMLFLQGNEGLLAMPGAGSLRYILALGTGVIAIFSAILLFYTNSFLMKRRRKELGLFNILGMEKRHIACMLAWELVFTALIAITGGIAAGVLLSKLLLLLLCRLLSFDVPFGFSVSAQGMYITAAVFLVIFVLNLLSNLRRIHLSRPIELLLGGNTGEREPRTKWALALIGILTLGAGYGIAIAVKSPLSALELFFVAVILVIVGTYYLFTAVSILILKQLRKNKSYYYQTKHFIPVSGMLHRMKRNAAGLASICILCTMVLVMVSGTLCLHLGAEDVLKTRYPHDVTVTYWAPGARVAEDAVKAILSRATRKGIAIRSLITLESLSFFVRIEGGKMTDDIQYMTDSYDMTFTHFITAAEYERLTGKAVSLGEGEVLTQGSQKEAPDSFELLGKRFTVKEHISDFPFLGEYASQMSNTLCFVLSEPDLREIQALRKAAHGDNAGSVAVDIHIDLEGSDADKLAFYEGMAEELTQTVAGEYNSMFAECRAANARDFYALHGGFFFLGLFLGSLFLMATVLIIYYKQISEGYEDAERFQIMQQVGMSEREVRSSIKSQILTVFFLPLAMAALHITAAFPMISRLLLVFSLTNVALFAWCTLGTFLAFALIYAFVYALTARAYYQIVKI